MHDNPRENEAMTGTPMPPAWLEEAPVVRCLDCGELEADCECTNDGEQGLSRDG